MTDIDDRIKELNCFFVFSHLLEKDNLTLEELLAEIVTIFPPAWQYSEITCARLVLAGKEYKTCNFQKTIWKQVSNIIVHSEPMGVLEVYYLEEKPEADEGPFLNNERNLLDVIAEQVGRMVERKQAEKLLQESEKRLRNLIGNSLTGISIVQDNQVVYQNKEQEKLFGPLPRSYTFADFTDIHPEDREKVQQFTRLIHSGEAQALDTDFRFYSLSKEVGKSAMKWVYCRALATKYQGRAAILFNVMDVSKSKELEHLVNIQDKMSSLGRVAAGIAHEIRNPLSGINIYLNTLEKLFHKEGSAETVKRIFRQVKTASSKIESIIKRVMDFSKPGQAHLILTDVNHPVEEAINLSAVTLRKSGITIEKILTPELPRCYADLRLLEEAVLNFITNAAEAMKSMQKKIIRISTTADATHVFVQICDSGPGVPEALREKIFDPFFTTKNDSSGIGLSITHRIITDHGGFVTVGKSDLGGAKFLIKIPANKGTGHK